MQVDETNKLYDVEVGTSSAWMLAFLLYHHKCGKRSVMDAALGALRHFVGIIDEQIPVMFTDDDLPPCNCLKDANNECRTFKGFIKRMERVHGDDWRHRAAADALWNRDRHGHCDSLNLWLYQIFWQIAELIDVRVIEGALLQSADGIPVLQGKKKARRMTAVVMANPQMGFKTVAGARVVTTDPKRRHDHASRLESFRIARYQSALVDLTARQTHVALGVDAMSAPFEMLTIIACLPLSGGLSAWCIPMDRLGLGRSGSRVGCTVLWRQGVGDLAR